MIYKFLIVSSLAVSVYCQFSTTTPSPHPPAQVHYVNIGADLAGDYKFGYDTGKGPSGQSFREETRAADGTVRGAYGYTDANGQQRIVKYSAGKDGFKIEDDSPAPSSGGSAPTPAPYRPPQTNPPQIYRPPQTAAPQVYRPQPQPQPQAYRPPSNDGSYSALELNPRPVQTYRVPQPQQTYRAPAPAQTLRTILPPTYVSQPSSQGLSAGVSYGSLPSSVSSGSSSSISYPPSQPSLQTYRAPAAAARAQSAPALSQPNLRTYASLATTPRPEEETWGPPVINTALLSYNIGNQG